MGRGCYCIFIWNDYDLSRTLYFSSEAWILQKRNRKPSKTELEDKSKKRSEEIARMIHPHDDDPDPTAHRV